MKSQVLLPLLSLLTHQVNGFELLEMSLANLNGG